MENHSYEIEFDLHENEPVGGIHFCMDGFAPVPGHPSRAQHLTGHMLFCELEIVFLFSYSLRNDLP